METERGQIVLSLKRCGKRGAGVEKILEEAHRLLPSALDLAHVRAGDREAVAALVLEAVWRWWIPEAKARLKSGAWRPENLENKLRTAMVQYAKHKARDEHEREETQRRMTAQTVRFEQPEEGFGYSGDEERFLKRIMQQANGTVSALDPESAKQTMRMLILVRRATKGMKSRTTGWTWTRLAGEVASALHQPETE